MPQTLIEKIAQRFAFGLPAGQTVRAGDFLSIRPAHCMTHDNTDAVIPKFKSIGAKKVHDPRQPVFALDHDIQNKSAENLAKYAKIEAFAKEHGIDFYPAGRGIGHQIMLEEGYVLPGAFVVASDSHSNIYGALGALGTPVVRTDAAAIWSTGRTWWQVPEIVKVNLRGKLPPGVTGKDVIITLIGVFNKDEVLNCCLEFVGPVVEELSIEERMTISNMTTEWGVLAAVFPYDEVTREYLLARGQVLAQRGPARQEPRSPERAIGPGHDWPGSDHQRASPSLSARAARLSPEGIRRLEAETPKADADALYAKEIDFDLSAVAPFVAGPNEVKTIASAAELEAKNVRIDKAFLMSCVNGRLQDFGRAAEVIRGRKVAPHVKFYIAAASSEVEEQAKAKGYWQALMDAGAIALPAGCGACIGLGEGVLTDGEVGISATNRNFDGRMGSRKSQVYLASPAVVAASAVAGKIAVPVAADPRVGRDAVASAPRGAVASAPRGRRDSACGTGVSPVNECSTGILPMAEDTGGTPVPQRVIRVYERKAAAAKVEILPGFPASMSGELLFAPKDNLNTDGIYGKEYTYKTLPPEEMGKAAMANYDPEFQNLARTGDILVGGFNFGCGSSREQAATALKFRGIQLIVAGSFSQTYSRNAYNNGYVCIECPKLVEELKAAYTGQALDIACQGQAARTIRTGWQATIDFTRSVITVKDAGAGVASAPPGDVASAPRSRREGEAPAEPRTYTFPPLGPVAQELVIKGGFEAVIRDQLATME